MKAVHHQSRSEAKTTKKAVHHPNKNTKGKCVTPKRGKNSRSQKDADISEHEIEENEMEIDPDICIRKN